MERGALTYAQAEQAFAELERLRQVGQLSPADYTARLDALRVIDAYGRTWMLQEGTGQWFVYHNGAWLAATPLQREEVAEQLTPQQEPLKATEGNEPSAASRRKGRIWLALGGAALLLAAVAVALFVHLNKPGDPLREAPASCSIEHRIFDPDQLDRISPISDDQRMVLAVNGPPQAFTLAFDPLSGVVIEEWSYFTLGQQITFLDGAYQGGIETPAPQIQPGVAIPAPAMYPWEVLQEPRPACVVRMAGPALFLTSVLVLPGWNDGAEVARLWMLDGGGSMITVDGRLALVSIDPGVAIDLDEYGVSGLFVGALGEGAERVGAILSPGDGMGKYRLSLSPRGQGTTQVGAEAMLDLEGLSLAGDYTFGVNARASVVDRDGLEVPVEASGRVSISSVGDAFDIEIDAVVNNRAYQVAGMVASGLWQSWDRLPGLALGETWPPVARRVQSVQLTAPATRIVATLPTRTPPTATSPVELRESQPTSAGWRLLLHDTFDSNENEWFTGVRDDEKVRLTAELAQGRYSLLTEAVSETPSWAGQTIQVDVGSRFSISVQATQTGDATSYCGLYFAGSQQANRTVLAVSSQRGDLSAMHGDWKLDWTPSSSVLMDQVNQLSAASDGSEIVFFVNGQPVSAMEVTEFDVQRVGVVASYGSGAPTQCSFDDLEIYME